MLVSYKHAIEARNLQREESLTAKEAAIRLKQKYKFPQEPQTIERRIRGLFKQLTPSIAELPDVTPRIPPDVWVKFQPWMTLADIHAPNYHKDALTDALLMAKERKIKMAILPGDFVDNAEHSHYPDEARVSGQEAVSEIIHQVYLTLLAITDTFETVYIVRGNHDDRLARKLDKNLGMTDMYKIFTTPPKGSGLPNLYDRLNIVERYHMYVEGSPTGDWLVAHQLNFSSVRTKVASDLAGQHEINVITSHIHDLGITTSRTKSRHFAVAPGCLADENKMSYKVMRVSTHAPWVLGWAIINEHGLPEVFHYAKSYR